MLLPFVLLSRTSRSCAVFKAAGILLQSGAAGHCNDLHFKTFFFKGSLFILLRKRKFFKPEVSGHGIAPFDQK